MQSAGVIGHTNCAVFDSLKEKKRDICIPDDIFYPLIVFENGGCWIDRICGLAFRADFIENDSDP